jgi:hypothetical protein
MMTSNHGAVGFQRLRRLDVEEEVAVVGHPTTVLPMGIGPDLRCVFSHGEPHCTCLL